MKFFGRKKTPDSPSGEECERAASRKPGQPAAQRKEAASSYSEAEFGDSTMRQAYGNSRAASGGADSYRYSASGGGGIATMTTSGRYSSGPQLQPLPHAQAPYSIDAGRRVPPTTSSYRHRVSANGNFASESEDEGCVSEAETSTGGFNRGSRARASLPVMTRPTPAAGTIDSQLGIIFLTYNGITRKSLLPRSITSMDSVRALFLRTFPQLTVQHLESPGSQVYIHERMSNRFYVLTHLSDVRDGIMLKLVDGEATPVMKRSQSAYESSTSRDNAYAPATGEGSYRVQAPILHRTPVSTSRETSVDEAIGDTRVPGAAHQQRIQTASGMHTPLNQQQQHAISASVASPSNYAQYIPPAGTGNDIRTRHSYTASTPSTPTAHYGTLPRSASKPSPVAASMDVDATSWLGSSRGMTSSASYSTDIDAEVQSGSPDSGTQHRMAKMESQLANLTAWVQTTLSRPSSAMSDKISDGSSVSARSTSTSTPQPELNTEAQSKMHKLAAQAKDLRTEVRNLRRIHQAQAESVRDTISDVLSKIKLAISRVPGADEYPVRAKRDQADEALAMYRQDVQKLDNNLSDLEKCVEKLKSDVVNRRVHIDLSEVESMAVHLISTSKLAADLKVKFPKVQGELTSAISCELQLITEQDQYIRKEPDRIDESIKRIRQLTLTLSTLRRLAGVQEHRTPAIPKMHGRHVGEIEKNILLGSIRSIAPNHEQRHERLQAASLLLETKKALVTSSEQVPFEKSLEQTGGYLKEAENMGRPSTDNSVYDMIQQVKQTQRKGLKDFCNGSSIRSEVRPAPVRRQLSQQDKSRLIQNRDSVHWDADESDTEHATSQQEPTIEDNFVDVTEEPLRTSAFLPIGKQEPVRPVMQQRDGRGSAGVVRHTAQLSSIDYVPVRDIGPSHGSSATPAVTAGSSDNVDCSVIEAESSHGNATGRRQIEADSIVRLSEQYSKLQKLQHHYTQNGSAVNRDMAGAEARPKPLHSQKPLPAPKPVLKAAVTIPDAGVSMNMEYTRSTTV